eukprot:CAMPEP_0197073142 /NCGR_PEP_ID=MMETSP1384-20130603/210456_1 /TAXON_ID=29189 /ORGANISM="Ammonia sp." /LENGTH=192 /DNA_ID=CAMNT_0042511973 /DNA_START=90 /DNA_END=668 /DNA_ORIENTATION=+
MQSNKQVQRVRQHPTHSLIRSFWDQHPMMSEMRHPFHMEMDRHLQNMDSIVAQYLGDWQRSDPFHHNEMRMDRYAFSSADIEERDNSYEVQVDLPGLKKDDIELSVEDGMLRIRGERKYSKTEENKEDEAAVKYYHRERFSGSFSKSVRLPEDIEQDLSQISASYQDGVLSITVPKQAKQPEKDKAHRIKIN